MLEVLGVRVLEAALCLRETYADALGAGSGPTAYAPTSIAANEVRRVLDAVEDLLGLEVASGHDQVPAA